MYCKIRIWDKIGWKSNMFAMFVYYMSICTPVISMTLPDTTAIPPSESTTEQTMAKHNKKDYADSSDVASGNEVNDIFKWIIVVFSVILILLTVSCALFRWMSNQEAIFRSYGSEYSFYPPRRWKTMTPPPSYSELFPVHFPNMDSNGNVSGNSPTNILINPPHVPVSSSVIVSNLEEPSTSSALTTGMSTSSCVPVIINPIFTTWDQKTQRCFTAVYPIVQNNVPSESVPNNYLPSYEEALRMLSCQSA